MENHTPDLISSPTGRIHLQTTNVRSQCSPHQPGNPTSPNGSRILFFRTKPSRTPPLRPLPIIRTQAGLLYCSRMVLLPQGRLSCVQEILESAEDSALSVVGRALYPHSFSSMRRHAQRVKEPEESLAPDLLSGAYWTMVMPHTM